MRSNECNIGQSQFTSDQRFSSKYLRKFIWKAANILKYGAKLDRPVGVVDKSSLLERKFLDSISGTDKCNTLLTMARHRCNLSSERRAQALCRVDGFRHWLQRRVILFVSILSRFIVFIFHWIEKNKQQQYQ